MPEEIINKQEILDKLKAERKVIEAAMPVINQNVRAFPNHKPFQDQAKQAQDHLNTIDNAIAVYSEK